MKSIIINKPGGYNALTIQTLPSKGPNAEQYKIRVKAIGVNYADIIIREGHYTAAKGKYPLVPGFEFSGVIESKGKNAQKYEIGDTVIGYTLFGGYSTEQIVNEYQIRKLPENWSFEEGAGVLVTNLTAYHGITNVSQLRKGETILVHSAAGGVGSALIEQARAKDCKIIGIVGNHTKKEIAEGIGADEVVIKSKSMWEFLDKKYPEGFDVIFDANGLTTPKPGYKRLKLGGRLIIYGFAELFPRGKRPFLPLLVLKALCVPKFGIRNMTSTNRAIMGLNIAFLVDKVDLANKAMDHIMEMIQLEKISKPKVTILPFEKVVESHKLIETGNTTGKIILHVPQNQ